MYQNAKTLGSSQPQQAGSRTLSSETRHLTGLLRCFFVKIMLPQSPSYVVKNYVLNNVSMFLSFFTLPLLLLLLLL
jgi:hypothetical protein